MAIPEEMCGVGWLWTRTTTLSIVLATDNSVPKSDASKTAARKRSPSMFETAPRRVEPPEKPKIYPMMSPDGIKEWKLMNESARLNALLQSQSAYGAGGCGADVGVYGANTTTTKTFSRTPTFGDIIIAPDEMTEHDMLPIMSANSCKGMGIASPAGVGCKRKGCSHDG